MVGDAWDEDGDWAEVEEAAWVRESKRQALLMMRAYYRGKDALAEWVRASKDPGLVMAGVMTELDFFLTVIGKQQGWTPEEHVEALLDALEDGA